MKKILIINSNYYIDISKSLVNSAKNFLKKNKIKVNLINVPGIFETPIVLKKNINKFDGFVVLGCVIKGETPHFDLISRSTFDAILKISIDYSKPVCNGIITAYNKKQAFERCGKIKSRKLNKGLEAAKAVLSVMKNGPKKIQLFLSKNKSNTKNL